MIAETDCRVCSSALSLKIHMGGVILRSVLNDAISEVHLTRRSLCTFRNLDIIFVFKQCLISDTMNESNEAYMLQRDSKESMRLNGQHEFMRALSSNHLIHPSIPRGSLQAIADVGTGTGVWLEDTTHDLLTLGNPSGNIELVGFDVSPQQFPQSRNEGMDFVTHDIIEPFPQQYREEFDLVHVRLLSYAIKAHDLLKAVENLVEILR